MTGEPRPPAGFAVLAAPGRSLRKYVLVHDEAGRLPGVLDAYLREFADSTLGVCVLSGRGSPRATPESARAILDAFGRGYVLRRAMGAAMNRCRAYLVNDLLNAPRRCYTVRAVARKYGVPAHAADDPNADTCRARLRDLGVEMIVSISGTHLYGEALRRETPYGILCAHPGLLPEFRGLMPAFWTLAGGEGWGGVTVHFADAGLHTGPIVVRRRVRVRLHDDLDELIARGRHATAEAILDAVRLVEAGDPPLLAQGPGRRFGIPTARDVRRFRENGHRLD